MEQTPQILSTAQKVVLNDKFLNYLKETYPNPEDLKEFYQVGFAMNDKIATFPWETLCLGPIRWPSFQHTTILHERPVVYMFFGEELLGYIRQRLASHQQDEKFYLLIAAAAMAKYIGTTYEEEDRKKSQIYAIKRGLKAVAEEKAWNDIVGYERRQFVIASELVKENRTKIYYTCVPLGLEIASDMCHNVENKTNDWCMFGRDHWQSLGSRFYNSLCNNRKTNTPSREFFEFLAALGTNGNAEYLSTASGFATMIDLIIMVLNGRYQEVDLGTFPANNAQ